MTDKPVVAVKGPLVEKLEAGKEYWWCRCGRSQSQPYCDGSHKGTGLEPMRFKPTTDTSVRFCGCKQTGKAPFCDGSHLSL